MVQLFYIIASLHTLLCPFTKVEESFNIQATHDILYHRLNLSQYDHHEFPGVVPRSFIGPLALSLVSAPTVSIMNLMDAQKIWSQYVVRLALALIVLAAWTQLKNTLKTLYGSTFAWWYSAVTVTQYHFMFYMSRPLPNIMALPLVLLAYDGWLSNKQKKFLISAGASIIIFRSELAMLFGLFLIMDLYFKKIDVLRLLKIIIPAGLGLVALTVAVDSIFWGRLTWPEAEVFYYNTILNKSSDWGTSPFLWYFYSALPRGLGCMLIFIPIGVYLDKRMVQVAAPAFVYILLYSFLPHKELRFIIYVFPLLNMPLAACCSYVYIRRSKAPIFELVFWMQVVMVIGNIAMTLLLVCIAMTNYPGGVAMARFHKLLAQEPYVHVHIGNLAAQTGVTRFTQLNDHWKYSKNESLSSEQFQEFTHLLVEAKNKYSPSMKTFAQTHVVLDIVESFSEFTLSYKLMPPVKIKTRPIIYILERKRFREFPYGRNDDHIDAIETIEMTDGNVEEAADNVYVLEQVEDIYQNNDVNKVDEILRLKKETEKDPNILRKHVMNFPKKDMVTVLQDEINNKVDHEQIETVKPAPKEARSKKAKSKISVQFEDESTVPEPKLGKAKKSLDELKVFRQERKKKAIEKIKSETREEAVASARVKLKEIMKRHKQITDSYKEELLPRKRNESKEEMDGRGDIPDFESILQENLDLDEIEKEKQEMLETDVHQYKALNMMHDNVESIVDDVIARLTDRKLYDETQPNDAQPEDRQMILKLVEEVLSEKMNYTKTS